LKDQGCENVLPGQGYHTSQRVTAGGKDSGGIAISMRNEETGRTSPYSVTSSTNNIVQKVTRD